MIEDLIIGSGPTAWAAARGIISRGGQPVIIDFGQRPNVSKPSIKGSSALAVKGDSEREFLFGYPKSIVSSTDGRHLPISSARGGLSKIWGAGILMRSQAELNELSQIYDDIRLGYEALYQLLPSTGIADQTSRRFPLPKTDGKSPTSKRYEGLVESLQDKDSDVLVGYPRMAMKVASGACVRCGSCLTGCPESLFFSADLFFREMEFLRECIFIEGPAIKIEGGDSHSTISTPRETLKAKRVYLAAGPVATPAILQRSDLAPSTMTVQDSAVFYSSLVNFMPYSGDEDQFTSAHAVFFSTINGAEDFQAAAYESNDEYTQRLASSIPKLGRYLRSPKAVIKRINPIIGFLDSSVSGHLELNYYGDRTWVTRHKNSQTRVAANEAIRRIDRYLKSSGVRALRGLAFVPSPGSGYHSGAAMPMGGNYVDYSGRLIQAGSIQIVDATSLPKIPAGSHTFTAMANAYRIGAMKS